MQYETILYSLDSGVGRITLNPDCGFWETPRWVARRKLAALCEGARIVRQELGG